MISPRKVVFKSTTQNVKNCFQNLTLCVLRAFAPKMDERTEFILDKSPKRLKITERVFLFDTCQDAPLQ